MKPDLEDLADAILDGSPVDWDAIERSGDVDDSALVEQLRTLDTLRQVVLDAGSPAARPPVTWGHLQVRERLGGGAFGEVYRAFDPRLDRDVALKLLSPSSTVAPADASAIEEGRLLARVRHPNVVTIYGAERVDGRVGLWMELVKGRTLEDAIAAGAAVPQSEAIRIGTELCAAVAAVHEAGLLHRDIKAHNVMLSDEGRVVLMDFGAGLDSECSAESSTTGTPLYLAPEVLNGGQATVQSDIYSLGVLLYRLLTGTYPVKGRDLRDLRRAHSDRRLAGSDASSTSTIPQRLRASILRAIESDPNRRYNSAHEFADALSAASSGGVTRRLASLSAAAVLLVALAAWTGSTTWRGTGAAAGSTPWPAPVPTIAVMPFTNLGSEPGSDDFVDGLTTEVIRDLAQVDGLQVRSQTSSFYFKDRPRDLATVGADLKVGLILEASVLRAGDRLRVNAQLVRVPDDVPLWSERFDRAAEDVFAIQDDISRAIVNQLRLAIGQGQRRYQTNLAAYDMYLRARVLASRRGTDNARQAAQLFEQVIGMDPSFAPAHAGLAHAYAEMSWQLTDGSLSATAGLEGMRPAAERALELDPMLADAHAAMGATYAREQDWASAENEFHRAVELSSGLTHIQTNFALTVLLPLGKTEEAERLLTAALATDPLAATVWRELGWVQFYQGRFDEAVHSFRSAMAIDPALRFAVQGIARALTFAGRPDEAIVVWNERPVTDGDWERWLSHAYARAGRTADVERLMAANATEHPVRQAIVYSALGDVDRTFAALDRAADLAPQRVAQLLTSPEMGLLKDDPRLPALKRRLNLP